MRLVVTKEGIYSYLALSYRWGGHQDHATTTANLQDHLENIMTDNIGMVSCSLGGTHTSEDFTYGQQGYSWDSIDETSREHIQRVGMFLGPSYEAHPHSSAHECALKTALVEEEIMI
jgi:hypothetical protein